MAGAFEPTAFQGTAFWVAEISLQPGLLTNTNSFYAPNVVAGEIVIYAPYVGNANSFFAPTIIIGSVTLGAPLYANDNTVYAPSITQPLPPVQNQDMFVEIRSFTERRRF